MQQQGQPRRLHAMQQHACPQHARSNAAVQLLVDSSLEILVNHMVWGAQHVDLLHVSLRSQYVHVLNHAEPVHRQMRLTTRRHAWKVEEKIEKHSWRFRQNVH